MYNLHCLMLIITDSTFAASVLKIVYGIHAEDVNNRYLKLAEESMDPIANALVPGKFLVEHLPILKHVPSWFPGAGWKGLFIRWRDSRYRAKTLPLEYVKKGMVRIWFISCLLRSGDIGRNTESASHPGFHGWTASC